MLPRQGCELLAGWGQGNCNGILRQGEALELPGAQVVKLHVLLSVQDKEHLAVG